MRVPVRPTAARRSLRQLRPSIAAFNGARPALHCRPMRGVVAVMAALAVLVTASAAIAGRTGLLWSGSFAHGASSWTGVQANAGDFTVVPAPAGRPGMAARFIVKPGDVPIGNSGERAEVFKSTDEQAGTQSYWAWSVYFPRGSSTSPGTSWNVFTQWHHTGPTGVQPFSFEVTNDGGREWLRLRVWGGNADHPVRRAWQLMPLVRGRWYDFALSVKWAPDSSGRLQVWIDHHQVVPATQTPTLYAGYGVYLKQGFYRSPSDVTTEVYIAGTRRGSTLASIGVGPAAVATAAKQTARKKTAPAPVPKPKSKQKQSPTPVGPPGLVQSIKAGQTLKGEVTWAVTTSSPVKQVVFSLDDNQVTFTDTAAPFVHMLDTTKMTNGVHKLGLTVTLLDGTVVWRPYQIGLVTVDNGTT
jgi:Polysaccharide lyase